MTPKNVPAFLPDSASLERIRAALATTPALRIDGPPTFYASVVFKPPTLADYMKRWNLNMARTMAPSDTYRFGGGGIGVLQLVHWMIQAHRDREVRLVREQIDRELRALAAVR
jgi:L-ascorbate metabolism protein UlaG (beta-lactamase superfamily)